MKNILFFIEWIFLCSMVHLAHKHHVSSIHETEFRNKCTSFEKHFVLFIHKLILSEPMLFFFNSFFYLCCCCWLFNRKFTWNLIHDKIPYRIQYSLNHDAAEFLVSVLQKKKIVFAIDSLWLFHWSIHNTRINSIWSKTIQYYSEVFSSQQEKKGNTKK